MILLVGGARPNFVKLAPVYHELIMDEQDVKFCHTGQHWDQEMSGIFVEQLRLPEPDYQLQVGGLTHVQQISQVMLEIEPIVSEAECVVVPGDVNSSLGAALAAQKAGVPVVHLESGLRSGDFSMPEEVNRILIDRVSSLCLTHCLDACSNLMAEGIYNDRIQLVGNTMIDSLMLMLDEIGVKESASTNYILATLHRPALVDDPGKLLEVVAALEVLARDYMVIFPVHPRTRKNLPKPRKVHLLDPLPYKDFLWYMNNASLVITDSGGVQEETSAIGVPCLTYRTTTERPITCSLGTNKVVGTNPIKLVEAARDWLQHPPIYNPIPLWDGKAGPRAADAIVHYLKEARPDEQDTCDRL